MQEGEKTENQTWWYIDYETKGYHIRSTNFKLKIGDPPNDK